MKFGFANPIKEFTNDFEKLPSMIDKVARYIDQNVENNKITCKDVADYVGYNSDYLNRLFRKETGKTISQYLLGVRIKIAKELLLQTDMQISDIALEVGYSNFSYFTRTFRKYTDTTPSEYRELFGQVIGL